MTTDIYGKPIYTCPLCEDKAYIGDKRCLECNPVGLPVEQVHPKAKPTKDAKYVTVVLTDAEEVKVIEEPTTETPQEADSAEDTGISGEEVHSILTDKPLNDKEMPYISVVIILTPCFKISELYEEVGRVST